VFSKFFIGRPIFAAVLSIVITLTGAIAVFTLPLAQYPPITPPSIIVSCNYPGASTQVVAETVAAPIEQQVNGVEKMLYMSSQSTNDGSYSLTVTFEPGVNLNFAQVLVQNRVNLALPLLPDVVKATGVTTRKRSPDILLIVSLYSPDGSRDNLYLSNYATIQIRDELLRVAGVGDVFLFGQQDYSMRVWVDPEALASRNMTAADVVAALRDQNQQVAAGSIGQPPVSPGQEREQTLSTLGRLDEEEQFRDVILKTGADGRHVRVRDVGRVELAPKTQDIVARLDGQSTTSIAIFQLPDANAIDTADRLQAKMEELKESFPPGVDYQIAFDTTPFVRESVREVFNTLQAAVVLVALVVLVFLQNWRSALIPLVAVPVAIIGTFAVMAAIGFSLNNLTLFGLVLAIGIVVDDAIVVVEAVEHHIENGLTPRDATVKAMEQVSGPVIAVGLVLSAVFIPCAFISGITGQFFRQFALTIAVSTVISAFNSLTLSPALAALLLKPRDEAGRSPLPWLAFLLIGGWAGWVFLGPRLAGLRVWDGVSTPLSPYLPLSLFPYLTGAVAGAVAGLLLTWPINRLLSSFFWLFNLGFRHTTNLYTRVVGLALRGGLVVLVIYGGLVALTWYGFVKLPAGWIPQQDKGYLMASVQLPDASSLERTIDVVRRVDEIAADEPGVAHRIAVSGQSFTLGAYGPNFGNFFLPLKDFEERRELGQRLGLDMTSDAIAARLRGQIAKKIPDAIVTIFGAPPVQGLGTASGYKFIIEDRGDLGLQNLQAETENIIAKGNRTPGLTGLLTVFRANAPQLYVDVNREQTAKMGVQLNDVFTTLQVYLGSYYVNDFNKFGRTWQVVVQAEGPFRNEVEDVRRLRVRNADGNMVPLGALASVREINGPLILTRYNMYPAAAVNGNTAPGVSSGEAIKLVDDLARRELPRAMALEWTEINFMQIQAGSTAMQIFAVSVLLVFLVLAALYESWSLPLAVILVVPMCILGSLAGVWLSRSDVNIFTQIGFVVLVGLASKNAILIVEYAKMQREEGVPRYQATLEAVKLRLRPILMTSFAFILGVVPLMVAAGAGSEMRRTLGTAVFAGMLGVTLFGVFLTPVFFYVIDWLSDTRLFASPHMRLAGLVLLHALGILTLGTLWLLLLLFRYLRRREAGASGRGAAP
jgi:multidrug efflux pump